MPQLYKFIIKSRSLKQEIITDSQSVVFDIKKHTATYHNIDTNKDEVINEVYEVRYLGEYVRPIIKPKKPDISELQMTIFDFL